MTEAPSDVSRKTVRIALMIAELNDLEVFSQVTSNVCIQHLLQKRCGPLWVLSLVKILGRLH